MAPVRTAPLVAAASLLLLRAPPLLLCAAARPTVAASFVVPPCHPSTLTSLGPKQRGQTEPVVPPLSLSVLAAKTPRIKKVVPYGEESRKFRRTVFEYDDWVKSRVSERNFKYVANFLESGIYRNVWLDVGTVTLVAATVAAWNGLLVDGYVDFNGVRHDPVTWGLLKGTVTFPRFVLPSFPFPSLGGFLAFMLSFRTNQAYNRWDEARKAWAITINHTRNIVRNSAVWSSPEYEPDEAKRRAAVFKVAGAVWSFPRSLKRHFYGAADDEALFQEELRWRLDGEQAEALIAATHRPNRALFDIACAVNDLPMHFIRRDEIDKSVTVLIDQLGVCERLFSSPIPQFYTRHTARFLTVWLLLLPFGLYEPFSNSWNHILMVPTSAFAACFWLGLEELAVQLEEPFTILPLQVYSEQIGNSIGEIAEWHTDELTKDGGYGTRQWGQHIERPDHFLTERI